MEISFTAATVIWVNISEAAFFWTGLRMQRHIGVMVLLKIGYVLLKPVRGDEVLGGFPAAELHFSHNQGGEGRVKDIQLDGQGVIGRRTRNPFLFPKNGSGIR